MREEIPDADRLEQLRDYHRRYRQLPTYSSMTTLMGYGSKAAAHKLAARLSRAGFLETGPDKRLAPTKRFLAHKLVGTVRAGTPESPADVDFEPISLEDYLIDKPKQMLLVRVKGDSMVEAGILDGDLAVIDCGRTPRKGDIVVAIWNGETTIKELDFEDDRPVLKPHNSRMPVLRPAGTLETLGVYVGLVRRHAR